MNEKPEKVLQSKVLNDLRSRGRDVVAFKIQKTSDNGIPDVFFTSKKTGAVLLELKKKGEAPTKIQRYMIAKLNECGVRAFWCDRWEGWMEIKKRLEL